MEKIQMSSMYGKYVDTDDVYPRLYSTIYETSYGTVTATFKFKQSYHMAVLSGKAWCEQNKVEYIDTIEARSS